MSYTRKPAYRRLALIFACTAVVLCSAAVMHWSARDQRDTALRQCDLTEKSGALMMELADLRDICGEILERPGDAVSPSLAAALWETVEEITERGDGLIRLYGNLDLQKKAALLEDELDDMAQNLRQTQETGNLDVPSVTVFLEEGRTTEEYLREALNDAAWQAASSLERQRLTLHAASLLLVAAALGQMTLGFLLFSDTLNALTRPASVKQIVEKLSLGRICQTNLRRLIETRGLSTPLQDWAFKAGRTIHRHRTHSTFEACALNGDARIPLWGKHYSWSGRLKSVQRVFWGAYERSTWQALGRMQAHGLPCPLRIAKAPVRRNRFTVATVILTEHVGDVVPLKQIVAERLERMKPPDRRSFLNAVADFYNGLHAAGIRGFKPRYPHVAVSSGAFDPAAPTLYLFDLDKVWVGLDGPPRLLARIQCARDSRRLLHWLQPYLSKDEIELLRARLNFVGGAAQSDASENANGE